MNIFGRVSRCWLEISSVFTDLECNGICVYEHEQDKEVSRTHIHFYIEECNVTTECIKKRIRKICPEITKSDWAFNTKEVNRSCVTYMTKGILTPMWNTIEDLDPEEYRLLWEDRKPSGKMYQAKLQYVTRETASEAKKRKNDLINEMIIEINAAEKDCVPSQSLIVKTIVKVLNDNNVIFGRYSVRDYYDTITARRNPEKFVKQMEEFCCYRT